MGSISPTSQFPNFILTKQRPFHLRQQHRRYGIRTVQLLLLIRHAPLALVDLISPKCDAVKWTVPLPSNLKVFHSTTLIAALLELLICQGGGCYAFLHAIENRHSLIAFVSNHCVQSIDPEDNYLFRGRLASVSLRTRSHRLQCRGTTSNPGQRAQLNLALERNRRPGKTQYSHYGQRNRLRNFLRWQACCI